MKSAEVLNRITRLGREVLPSGGHLWLYGSRARGDARPTSDWDLLVLLDKDKLNGEDYDRITYPFTLLSGDIGEIINPIMYTKREWDAYSFTPFYHNVQDDKIELIWAVYQRKTGIFDTKYGALIARMEQLRDKADYNVLFDISEEDLSAMRPTIHELIDKIKEHM